MPWFILLGHQSLQNYLIHLCFCFCLTKSIMFKDEVTTQCFWGNEKSLGVASSLVLKIINLVLNTPEKPKLQGKQSCLRSAATVDLHFTALKRRFQVQGVRELHSSSANQVRYSWRFHHTSQIGETFHHQQTQETSSDKTSAHQTVYNLKMLGMFHMDFVLPPFNQQECAQRRAPRRIPLHQNSAI